MAMFTYSYVLFFIVAVAVVVPMVSGEECNYIMDPKSCDSCDQRCYKQFHKVTSKCLYNDVEKHGYCVCYFTCTSP
ncbi:hypothetical protein Lser_V15G26880 [Lactuca serriola]